MNTHEAALALKMLEETSRLLWRIFLRCLTAVVGVTGTVLLQAWLVVRLFPTVV